MYIKFITMHVLANTYYSRSITFLIFWFITVQLSTAQEISRSFELRYYTEDEAANGITDFHGETEVFNTDERIDFLRVYANYASKFFVDPGLNTRVVESREVQDFLEKLKPQPVPSIRRRIRLESWRWIGYNADRYEWERAGLEKWEKQKNAVVQEGSLVFTGSGTAIIQTIPSQTWRIYAEFDLQIPSAEKEFSFKMDGDGQPAVNIGVDAAGTFYYVSDGKSIFGESCSPGTVYNLKLEVDLEEGAYNFYVNDQLIADFATLTTTLNGINALVFEGDKGISFDNLYLVGYTPSEDLLSPYKSSTLLDEDFQISPGIEGWDLSGYDDSQWDLADLPKVHGGERYAGEDLYLRKKVS